VKKLVFGSSKKGIAVIPLLVEAERFDEALSALSAIESTRSLIPWELVLKGRCIQLSSGVEGQLERRDLYLRPLQPDDGHDLRQSTVEDFETLTRGAKVFDRSKGLQAATLADGTKLTVRPFSSGGSPALEIQPTGKAIKIRHSK
jgi:hypothetical protein